MAERLAHSILSATGNKQPITTRTNSGIVVDIILDENHPRVRPKVDGDTIHTEKDLSIIGHAVIRRYSDKTTPNEKLSTYPPINPYEMDMPVIGESVELVKIGGISYYRRVAGLLLNKGAAGENRHELTHPIKDTTNKQQDYVAASATGTPTGNPLVQTANNAFGNVFQREKINKLKLNEGDKLIQSRFGQSIRFSGYGNAGGVFAPTIILRNRQNGELDVKEGDIIEEDVNKDGSVIVLSSGEHQIPFIATTSITPFKFESYPNPLKGDDHLLINSGKIIISSKTGEMVFHSKGDYGFISDGKFSIDGGQGADLDFGNHVNITTDRQGSNFKVTTGEGKIFLNTNDSGESESTSQVEPLVRGKTLQQLLETMIDLILEQVYRTPSGPTAIGPENRDEFRTLKNDLQTMLSSKNFTE